MAMESESINVGYSLYIPKQLQGEADLIGSSIRIAEEKHIYRADTVIKLSADDGAVRVTFTGKGGTEKEAKIAIRKRISDAVDNLNDLGNKILTVCKT